MRKLLSVYTVIALLSLLMVSQAISIVSANPYGFTAQIQPPSGAVPPIISISSPQNNANYSGAFNITFSVKGPQYSNYDSDIVDITYKIDNESVSIPHETFILVKGGHGTSQYYTSLVAPNLAAGNHSLTVKAEGSVYDMFSFVFFMDSSSQVYFVTHEAPSIKLLTDQSANTTFSSFPLNLTVDQPTSWLGYSLDNLANVTIGGNKTLKGLSSGNHSIVVFGNNTFGDMTKSETMNFTIKEPEISFPFTVIALVVIAIIISLGLLVYLKKHKLILN